jgi:RNA polymerase sigma-70 factor (ECF subfamily)
MSQSVEISASRTTSLDSSRWCYTSSVNPAEAERDLEIVAAAQAGSFTGFAELQSLYSRRLFSTILRITKHREDAEDALQDTFLRAFLALPQFECRSSIYSWFTRIAINSALMVLRKRQARREADSVPLMDGSDGYSPLEIEDKTPNPEQLCDQRQRRTRLVSAIRNLPPQLRAPIVFQLTDERSTKEIARELNISLPAVKSRLYRARTRLAKRTAMQETMLTSTLQ